MSSFTFGFNYGRSKKVGGYDADASAFFTAASITDSTQKSAVNQLVLDLKSYNIWTKMKAIYPVVGGSASAHAVNLKTPGTYNLTFATGVTHASTGMTGNGTTGYANTSFTTNGYSTNNHLSSYIRTNVDEVKVDIGAYETTPGRALDIESRISNIAYNLNYISGNTNSYANTDSRGFYINTRTTSTNHKVYKNGTLKGTDTASGVSNFTRDIFILARNDAGTPSLYSTKQCAFASIGDGLTDTEAANFYTAVQAYQTTLSRNV